MIRFLLAFFFIFLIPSSASAEIEAVITYSNCQTVEVYWGTLRLIDPVAGYLVVDGAVVAIEHDSGFDFSATLPERASIIDEGYINAEGRSFIIGNSFGYEIQCTRINLPMVMYD